MDDTLQLLEDISDIDGYEGFDDEEDRRACTVCCEALYWMVRKYKAICKEYEQIQDKPELIMDPYNQAIIKVAKVLEKELIDLKQQYDEY